MTGTQGLRKRGLSVSFVSSETNASKKPKSETKIQEMKESIRKIQDSFDRKDYFNPSFNALDDPEVVDAIAQELATEGKEVNKPNVQEKLNKIITTDKDKFNSESKFFSEYQNDMKMSQNLKETTDNKQFINQFKNIEVPAPKERNFSTPSLSVSNNTKRPTSNTPVNNAEHREKQIITTEHTEHKHWSSVYTSGDRNNCGLFSMYPGITIEQAKQKRQDLIGILNEKKSYFDNIDNIEDLDLKNQQTEAKNLFYQSIEANLSLSAGIQLNTEYEKNDCSEQKRKEMFRLYLTDIEKGGFLDIFALSQLAEKEGKTLLPIYHKSQGAVNPRDLIKKDNLDPNKTIFISSVGDVSGHFEAVHIKHPEQPNA